jgi:hypothetical protein
MSSEARGFLTRRAQPADAGSIADLWSRSRRAAVASIPPTVHTDAEVHEWFATVVLPTRETWLIEDEAGAVVALSATASRPSP